MNGVIIINKPEGFTSFDAVAVVRHLLHTKKVGHCGTLDPNATGVLPVLVGHATKAQDIIPNHDKSYIASFCFGKSTDTLDIWGSITGTDETPVTKEDLLSVLARFQGEILQKAPMYSAVSVDGKRLYELARQGIEVERKKRPVTIYSLELLSYDEQERSGSIAVCCSRGTYIRSLIDDIARELSTIGVMTSLVRTKACGFTLSDALTIEQCREYADKGTLTQHIRDTQSLFSDYISIVVSDAQASRFSNGNPLDIERTQAKGMCKDAQIFRVNDKNNTFLGLGIADLEKGVIKIRKLFARG